MKNMPIPPLDNLQRRSRAARPVAYLLLSLLAFALTGCGLFGVSAGGGGNVGSDIYELRQAVQGISDTQRSVNRTSDHRLTALETKIDSLSEMLSTNLGEIERRIRNQSEEIDTLQKEIASLAFQLETLATLLEIKPTEASKETKALLRAKEIGQESFEEGERQFNLGRYELARKSFAKALEQGLVGEKQIEAQYWLAESYSRVSNLDAAYDEYTKLIQSRPSHVLAWRSLERLAAIEDRRGRYQRSLELYGEIIKRNPNYDGIERVRESSNEVQAKINASGTTSQ